MKNVLIFTALLYSATGFSQNQCSDLFSQPSRLTQKTQITESDILKHLDALVAEKLRIDYDRFENENQKKQAIETFKTDLNNIRKIDQKYLTLFKLKYSEKTVQYNIKLKSKDKEKRQTENDRRQVLEKKHLNPYEKFKIEHRGMVLNSQFSPDSKYVVTGAYDQVSKIFDVQTGKQLFETHHMDMVVSTAFSADSQCVLSLGKYQSLKIHNISNGKKIFDFGQGHNGYMSAKFSPDGLLVGLGTWGGSTEVVEVATGKRIFSNYHEGMHARFLNFSPDGKKIVSSFTPSYHSSNDFKLVRFSEILSGEVLFEFKSPDYISSVKFSPDGKYLVLVLRGGHIKILDIDAGGTEVQQFKHDLAYSAEFSKDGKYLLIGAGEELNPVLADHKAVAVVYEITTQKIIFKANEFGETLLDAQFTPDNKHIVTLSDKKNLKIFEFATGKMVSELLAEQYRTRSFEISSDGQYLLLADDDASARVFKLFNSANELIGK